MRNYVEAKYNFTFPFTEKNPMKFTEPFGCCGFWQFCDKEKFCVIPNSFSNSKRWCGLAKRDGYDQIAVVKIKILKSKIMKMKKLRGNT